MSEKIKKCTCTLKCTHFKKTGLIIAFQFIFDFQLLKIFCFKISTRKTVVYFKIEDFTLRLRSEDITLFSKKVSDQNWQYMHTFGLEKPYNYIRVSSSIKCI